MQKTFEPVIDNIYSHNQPMPVVSVPEIRISIEKSSVYWGTIELINSGEGVLMGYVETVNELIYIQEKLLTNNYQVISYQVDASNLDVGELYEDKMIITYNGGEITLPIFIQVIAKDDIKKSTCLKPKKNDQLIDISANRRSYQADETGFLTIRNNNNRRIVVRMIPEDPWIAYKNKEIEITEQEKIEFSFKVSKLDRMMGKIPLKTNPKIEMKIKMEVQIGAKTTVFYKSVYLTELSGATADDRIASERAYKKFLTQLIQKYQGMVLVNNDDNFFALQKDIESALLYDKTNIELRLIHLYINILKGRKKAALEEINQIEHFLLHYDYLNSDVSDLLMFFVDLLKGEHVEDLIHSWKPKTKENWLKIIIKNRTLTFRSNAYEEYKALYELGAKNTILFIEASDFLNHNPIIPTQDDRFYPVVLRWSINHNYMGGKWIKKIENNSYAFIKEFPMAIDVAEKLYALNPSKNMHTILCNSYMANMRLDLKALQVYSETIIERIHIHEIDIFYIMASYHCKKALRPEVLKMMYKVNELSEPYRCFYLLHLKIFRNTLRAQYHAQEKEILSMNSASLPLGLELKPEEKEIYLLYLFETCQVDLIIQLNQKGFFDEIDETLYLHMIVSIGQKYPEIGAQIGLKALRKKGVYNPETLNLVAGSFKGDLSELLNFYRLLKENDVVHELLEEDILYKGIISRKYSQEIIQIFIGYCKKVEHASNHKWLIQYLIRQILIEDFIPSKEMLSLLEHDYVKRKVLLTGLAILKGSIQFAKRNEKRIHELILEYIQEDILLPWFELLVPKEVLGERWRFMECFEYYSVPSNQVLFYYRLDDDYDYHVLEMKPMGLGLFTVNIILFYNERLQYYIKDIGENRTEDVRFSDIYCMERSEEQPDVESLYDRINTIEMSKTLDDDESLKLTIENYFAQCKKEIEQFEIL